MAKGNWIDFKELRQTLDFREVLHAYGVELKEKSDEQLAGFCPLPDHGGNKKSESFSVNVARNIFNCFGCGKSGNILEFAMLMEGRDLEDGKAFREIARMLQERASPGSVDAANRNQRSREAQNDLSAEPDSDSSAEQAEEAETEAHEVINAPLDFELKNLDANHEYLRERGFLTNTVEHFGAGYCARGLMKGRIAIPVHNPEAELVGYAGRLVDDSEISSENPKYRFPGKREHGGQVHQFRKSELLYCSPEIWKGPPLAGAILVEGFTDVWWLWQNGFENVFGLMGSVCSRRQGELVGLYTHPAALITIITDGDDAGRRCALSILENLSTLRACRWITLEEGCDPTDYTESELCEMLP